MLFRSKVLGVCPGFQTNESNTKILNAAFKYVNNQEGPLDPAKGIFLYGDIGTGKSTIIRIIGEVLRIKGEGYKTVNCSWLSNEFAMHGNDGLNSSAYNDWESGPKPVNRAFDELGREPIPTKHYGTELNVMQYIFQIRYDLRKDVRTFATTNLNFESLRVLYGDHILDRFTEMFNIIEMNGESLRK